MCPIRFSLAVLCTMAVQASAREPIHYVDLINRAHDSVAAFAMAVPGSDAFREMPLGAALRGGGDSATLEVAGEDCRYDLRFTFVNGRSLVYRDVDICRYRVVRIRPLPRMPGNG